MWNVSICHGKLQDLPEILTSKSGIMAEFSKYRFSRKEIDFQPNEVCSDLFHIKVYLTAEYERNRCFSCCHHFSKIFDFWQHSFLITIMTEMLPKPRTWVRRTFHISNDYQYTTSDFSANRRTVPLYTVCSLALCYFSLIFICYFFLFFWSEI